MQRILLFIFFLITKPACSQDSNLIAKKIDSIWAFKIKATKQKIKSPANSPKYRVWYAKRTNDILLIEEVHYPVLDEQTKFWIYNYHFRNGKLILISKYNNAGKKDYRRKICFYYFDDNRLLYRHEFKTSITDVDNEKTKAYVLKKQFEKPLL